MISAKAASKAPVKPDNLTVAGNQAWDEVAKCGDVVRQLKSSKADKVALNIT